MQNQQKTNLSFTTENNAIRPTFYQNPRNPQNDFMVNKYQKIVLSLQIYNSGARNQQ